MPSLVHSACLALAHTCSCRAKGRKEVHLLPWNLALHLCPCSRPHQVGPAAARISPAADLLHSPPTACQMCQHHLRQPHVPTCYEVWSHEHVFNTQHGPGTQAFMYCNVPETRQLLPDISERHILLQYCMIYKESRSTDQAFPQVKNTMM